MSRIGIFSSSHIDKAYSCFLYLKRTLNLYHKNVTLWSFSEKAKLSDEDRANYHSYRDCILGRIRFVRFLYMNLKFFFEARKYDVIIIQDLSLFIMAYFLKLLYPKKIIIHYNTEIHGKDVRLPWFITRFYEKKAAFPDMIIDCLKERAEYRKKTFKINKPVWVINNTLPISDIEKASKENLFDIEKYFTFDEELPVLIYAGGCNLSRCLDDVIACCPKFEHKLNFLLLCYGSESDYSVIEKLCDKNKNCRLFHAVSKTELFQVMDRCDIGIQYYEPNYSINHKYASPSKFFEYMALGLNVISSNNEGINRIITENNIGLCLEENETFEDCLNRLLNKGLEGKNKIKQIFKEKYCYEVDSKKTISEIINTINNL